MQKILYMPLTAVPFRQNHKYKEVLPQSRELAKYIRCFWGSGKPYMKTEENTAAGLVIPDTCVDIIYLIDHTKQTVSGGFYGINDASFFEHDEAASGHLASIFAIRFYAWDAYVFSEDSLKGTVNGFFDVQSRFRWLDVALRQQLLEKQSLKERIHVTEELFLRHLFCTRHNHVIDQAVAQILLQKGALGMANLAGECFVSGRQLERLFHEYIGITPKKLGSLVRYQFLWADILKNPEFNIQDAVYKYGYTDQSHLMREFKRFHAMDIRTAKAYAYKNVGNILYADSQCGL